VWEARKFLTGEAGPKPEINVVVIGFVAAPSPASWPSTSCSSSSSASR
jgi:hypothetical protein